jgi:hypothetical protein
METLGTSELACNKRFYAQAATLNQNSASAADSRCSGVNRCSGTNVADMPMRNADFGPEYFMVMQNQKRRKRFDNPASYSSCVNPYDTAQCATSSSVTAGALVQPFQKECPASMLYPPAPRIDTQAELALRGILPKRSDATENFVLQNTAIAQSNTLTQPPLLRSSVDKIEPADDRLHGLPVIALSRNIYSAFMLPRMMPDTTMFVAPGDGVSKPAAVVMDNVPFYTGGTPIQTRFDMQPQQVRQNADVLGQPRPSDIRTRIAVPPKPIDATSSAACGTQSCQTGDGRCHDMAREYEQHHALRAPDQSRYRFMAPTNVFDTNVRMADPRELRPLVFDNFVGDTSGKIVTAFNPAALSAERAAISIQTVQPGPLTGRNEAPYRETMAQMAATHMVDNNIRYGAKDRGCTDSGVRVAMAPEAVHIPFSMVASLPFEFDATGRQAWAIANAQSPAMASAVRDCSDRNQSSCASKSSHAVTPGAMISVQRSAPLLGSPLRRNGGC